MRVSSDVYNLEVFVYWFLSHPKSQSWQSSSKGISAVIRLFHWREFFSLVTLRVRHLIRFELF